MAYQIEALWNGLRDSNGNAYSGAIVVMKAAGTDDAKVIWQDADKTLPTSAGLSQFTLDSNGRYKAFGDGAYKIQIYAPTDTGLTSVIYEIDGVTYGWGDAANTYATATALKATTTPSI